MEIFPNLRTKVSRLAVKRIQKNRKRNKKVFNLSTARSIGIIFDGTDLKNFDGTFSFYRSLKEKGFQLSVLAYVNAKNIPDKYLFKENLSFLTTNEVNWYYKPKSKAAQVFFDKQFDILINLDMNNIKAISFISTISLARFKVGRYSAENKFSDMSIKLDREPTLEFFIQQVMHYLELINRPDLRPKFENV